jgi:hypothetical protein
MVEQLRHRQTKEAANRYVQPKATASHSDSTTSEVLRNRRPRLDFRYAPFANRDRAVLQYVAKGQGET